jgi:hypothetical protein
VEASDGLIVNRTGCGMFGEALGGEASDVAGFPAQGYASGDTQAAVNDALDLFVRDGFAGMLGAKVFGGLKLIAGNSLFQNGSVSGGLGLPACCSEALGKSVKERLRLACG